MTKLNQGLRDRSKTLDKQVAMIWMDYQVEAPQFVFGHKLLRTFE